MWQVLIFPAFAGAILIPEGCQNIPLCGQLPWSEWGLCSRTCGGGSQTRKREVCGLQEWNEEDVEDQCGKPPRLEYRVCNTNCFNGGIFADDICICYHGKTGRCCENEITSLEKLVTSKEKASSFLREVGIRSKRDHHIDEECSESGSCDHEEVEEWISYKHDPRDVCTWMKDRRCNERSCGAGYRCITINRDCSRYSHYQVGCTDIDECASNPCNHGGTCHNYQNRFSCTCPDEYYGTRCEYTCRKPVNCLHQKCNTWDDFICTECMNQGSDRKHSIYYVSTDRKKCEATCSWKQNWCWPGTCTQNLAKNCHCSNGFHLSSRDSHKICNLNIAPDLETCRLGVQNIGGEARNSTSTGPCLQEKYNYMKFQPEYSSTVFTFGSTINVSSNVPDHISEYQFGIVNTTISVSTRNINGHQKNQKYLYLKQTNSCSRNNFTDTNPISTIITCKMTIATPWIIQDGEQLCMEFTAYAGGYLKTKDFHGNPSLPHIYRTTQSSYEVCMRRDSAAPKHCLEDNSCTKNEVILFENRITNSADLNISLNGWFDPYRYTPEEASGIQSYSITIHDMKEVDKSTLSMDEGSLLTLNISSEVDSIQLPDKQPALYGVSLNILDNAGNFKQARRFVLFDNSSEIQINAENKLIVYTGNKATNFTWQTNHGKICVRWDERYYNSFHIHHNLLRKIKADYHSLYNGVYEQNNGQLPVKGTPNIHGILEFRYVFALNNRVLDNKTAPNFLNQSICENYSLRDGETYDVTLIPRDVMNNTIRETIAVHIDASVPDIVEMYLIKDGVRHLFVHNSTDLSRMKISFKALDEHSGLNSIEWMLGTSPDGGELGKGSIAVNRLEPGVTCNHTENCYCPKVGVCEKALYSVKFSSLIKNNKQNGHHNRGYFFTVKVTNNAMLVSISRTDILADDSPPVGGNAMEGEIGSQELDYTCNREIIVRWSGFIDHESGIKKYRIGFNDKCLSREDLLHNNHTTLPSYIYETNEQQIKVRAPYPGLYFTSVIAYNYAMESSEVACSNGITYDISPPKLYNIILEHSKTTEGIACYNRTAWLILQNFTGVKLEMTQACQKICNDSSNEFPLLENMFYVRQDYYHDTSYADSICKKLGVYIKNNKVYIPSDTISVSWNITDLESQIHDIKIGFASTKSQSKTPDILSFTPTKRLQSDKRLHSALDSGTPFFITIKATSKAGLETSATIGPVVIDDTPPLYRGGVNIVLDDKFAFVVWTNETFVDEEQDEPISMVLFKIGQGSTFKTPLLQGYLSNSCPNPTVNLTCLKYPIRRIQQLNENNTVFFFELYAYNSVGHATTVRTVEFSVPSRYPPTAGTVLEISSNFPGIEDTDYIESNEAICFYLSGFKHIETVSFEVAYSTNLTDDLMPFRTLPSAKCFYNLSLPENTRIYTLIKATSSGGSTISSSDGFFVINESKAEHSINVHDGISCNSVVPDYQVTASLHGQRTEISIKNKSLLTGNPFTLQISGIDLNLYDIRSEDVIWTGNSLFTENILTKPFVPMIEHPRFLIKFRKILNTTLLVKIINCNENAKFQTNSKVYFAYWSTKNPYKNLITHFRTGLLVQRGTTESFISALQTTISRERARFGDVLLEDGLTYRVITEACFERLCIQPQKSNGSKMQYETNSLSKIHSFLKKSNDDLFELKLQFDGYQCSDNSYSAGYAVALADERGAELSNWKPISIKTNMKNITTSLQNISLPVYTQHSLSVCVRGFCLSGTSAISCQPIKEKENSSDLKFNYVFEINANSPDIKEIKLFAHSRYLGDKLKVLHNNEVDFIQSDWRVNGVLLGTFNRTIIWYIMTEERLPLRSCTDDVACIQEIVSKDSIGYFKQIQFTKNKRYFLCAFANKTLVKYEKSLEQEGQVSVCGNGFIIDDTAPIPGKVHIKADFGNFLNMNKSISLTWEGFSDIERDLIIEYTSGIEKYTYSIGTYPGGEDVVSFTDAGLLTSATVHSISFTNHVAYYATVRAIDRVGHITEVSSDGVMFDDSPPVQGRVFVDGSGLEGYITNCRDITVTWEGFKDPESGIKSFKIGIGSTNLSADIFQLMEVRDTYWKPKNTDGKFLDGYEYFILLMITNNAGLSILVSSRAFIVDGSPPHEGNVIDGNEDGIDLDFQRNITHICSRWDGFHDPHTKVTYYEIGLGTSRGESDVFPLTSVGLVEEFCWANEFIPGEKYFTIIWACNQAGLCTSKSSNGVILDNSPPIAGLVRVSMGDSHQHYISHKHIVSAQWIGFQDPHSDIEHFEFCISKSRNDCDITAFENVLLSERITKTSIDLPQSTNLYIIVKAYNRVGMSSQQSSEKFCVDTSPPILVTKPVFETAQFSHKSGTQYDDSVLIIKWKFKEKESFIASNEVVLKSHKNGKTVTDIKSNGNDNNITIKLENENSLKSGDTYYVFISSCNAAGLCTHASSDPLLIDSSPPQLGGFRNLMKWKHFENKTTELLLLWHGFSDIHSGIERYGVFVSESYTGSELSNGVIIVDHIDSEIQMLSLNLTRQLSETDEIILSIYALNGVGLRSKIAKTTVTLVSDDILHASGFLELQRYLCRSHTCNNDCTCSVVGSKCQDESLKPGACKRIDNHAEMPMVSFGDAMSSSNLTLSSKCVFVQWKVRNMTRFQRFEWSIGIQHEEAGVGVFDSKTESVWRENGQLMNTTFCMENKNRFQQGESYVFYVRSWISEDTYFEKQSEPLLVDTTPPAIRQGKSIKETLFSCNEEDVDFLNSTSDFFVCWDGVFIEKGAQITKYSISSGSSPFGNDLLDVQNVGRLTSILVEGKLLKPGVTFYFTITATNKLGLKTSFTSDGVLIDLDNPTRGIVYNTKFHRNIVYQSSTSEIGISWHGFDDHNSFIKKYHATLFGEDKNETIRTVIDAKIHNSYIFHKLSLEHNRRYRVALIAFDAVGHFVGPVYAQDLKIDNTPPKGFRCTQRGAISLARVNTTKSVFWTKVRFRYQLSANLKAGEIYHLSVKADASVLSKSIYVLVGGEKAMINLLRNIDDDVFAEHMFIPKFTGTTDISIFLTSKDVKSTVITNLHQCLSHEPSLDPIALVQVLPNYVSVSLQIKDIESGIKSIYLGIGTTRMGYQVRSLRPFSMGLQEIVKTDVRHNSSLYFTAVIENNAGLKSTFHSKPILIDHSKPEIHSIKSNVTYKEISLFSENSTNEFKNTSLRLIEKRTWTTVNVTWEVVDKESGIRRCECGVGVLPFSTSTVSLRKSDTTMSCIFLNLDIRHGTRLFFTVQCTNGVGLRETKTHGPIIISINKPDEKAAEVSFIPNNRLSVEHAEPMIETQSNRTSITFSWNGFSDISSISEYETRLLKESKVISSWRSVGLKTYTSYDIHAADGDIYTAEVKALNLGGLLSNANNKSITVDARSPQLTGDSLVVRKISTGKYMIDWSNVFEGTAKGSTAFIVSVGTNRGYSDLQSPTYTQQHSMTVNTDTASVIYINIRGISPTGESRIYHMVYATN